jgi:hypothetical protein
MDVVMVFDLNPNGRGCFGMVVNAIVIMIVVVDDMIDVVITSNISMVVVMDCFIMSVGKVMQWDNTARVGMFFTVIVLEEL